MIEEQSTRSIHYGEYDWFIKLIDDIVEMRYIDFEGRPVPVWAQHVLEERMPHGR